MTRPLFIQGTPIAPYLIFVRCAGRYSDMDLLRLFGLSTYEQTTNAHRGSRYAILADDGQWKVIADDWFYTLWHMSSTRSTIAALGANFDLFACSVGDCDHSFDFEYYRDSRLVRRYVVADPHFKGGVVVENVGEQLPGEMMALKQSDEFEIVLAIAASLGIKTDYTEQDVRVYSPLQSDRR